ncbi:uncharacterized protein V6R79_004170 [Siganus canaliculatus]
MGCSTSTQTSAVDTTRPCAKPEESNGASTTGVANENGNVAEDSETIPDQTPAQSGDAKSADDPSAASTAVTAESTAAAPPTGEEPQPEAANQPAAPEDAPAAADGDAAPAEKAPSE